MMAPTGDDFFRHGRSSKEMSPLQYHNPFPRLLQIRSLYTAARGCAESYSFRTSARAHIQQNSRRPSHCVLHRLSLRRTAWRGRSRGVRAVHLCSY